MTLKNFDYSTSFRAIVSNEDGILVTSNGCGCCCDYNTISKEELVNDIETEIKSLQDLLKAIKQ